jgi:transposase
VSSEDRSCARCALFIGLRDVDVVELKEAYPGLVLTIETKRKPVGCPSCGVLARAKGRRAVQLVDLPCFDRRTTTIWVKRRFTCLDPDCERGSFTEVDDRIAPARSSLTTRAGRWVTHQVGAHARSVAEVADDLGCSWHTVNDAVIAWGEALLDADLERIGEVEALGLDEVAFARLGERRRTHFATTIADTRRGQLLDVVPGRGGTEPVAWIEARSEAWRSGVKWATLDLSSTFRSVFTRTLPGATLVADPFHVVRHANSKLDECRRRVQNETLGHRGRKADPLFKSRRLLTMAKQRLTEEADAKRLGLLKAGDPKGEVATTWHAKEAVRELYAHADQATAAAWIDELITTMADKDQPIEVRSLGRTLKRWRDEIIAWHRSQASNGPTEAVNNLVKRVKRAAFGFRSFRSFRVRALLYAGKPNWSLLAGITPH